MTHKQLLSFVPHNFRISMIPYHNYILTITCATNIPIHVIWWHGDNSGITCSQSQNSHKVQECIRRVIQVIYRNDQIDCYIFLEFWERETIKPTKQIFPITICNQAQSQRNRPGITHDCRKCTGVTYLGYMGYVRYNQLSVLMIYIRIKVLPVYFL